MDWRKKCRNVASAAPAAEAVTPALIAVAAGGSVAGLRTTVALNWTDGKAAFEKARYMGKAFRSAGRKK